MTPDLPQATIAQLQCDANPPDVGQYVVTLEDGEPYRRIGSVDCLVATVRRDNWKAPTGRVHSRFMRKDGTQIVYQWQSDVAAPAEPEPEPEPVRAIADEAWMHAEDLDE